MAVNVQLFPVANFFLSFSMLSQRNPIIVALLFIMLYIVTIVVYTLLCQYSNSDVEHVQGDIEKCPMYRQMMIRYHRVYNYWLLRMLHTAVFVNPFIAELYKPREIPIRNQTKYFC